MVLTKDLELLDSHTLDRDDEARQAFYAGVSRPREIDHDANLYATYRQEEARLRDEHGGLDIRRIVLEQDLKREYQEFLQEHNRNRPDSNGRRTETRRRSATGRANATCRSSTARCTSPATGSRRSIGERHEDVELFTPHYRGAHAVSRAKTGFRIYVVGSRGGGGPRRIRVSWRNSCDAPVPAQSDVRWR